MAITFHPKVGQILLCDFSVGFKEPEMVKSKRPVIVVALSKSSLVTVIPLSTKEPENLLLCHYKVPKKSMPQLGNFQEKDSWLKGDMLYSVGFHRLDLIKLNKRDPNTKKRIYYNQRFGRDQMKEVYKCMLHGLNLGVLGQHL
jgi:uncharacterized protein YifN (PemK superfamily)